MVYHKSGIGEEGQLQQYYSAGGANHVRVCIKSGQNMVVAFKKKIVFSFAKRRRIIRAYTGTSTEEMGHIIMHMISNIS